MGDQPALSVLAAGKFWHALPPGLHALFPCQHKLVSTHVDACVDFYGGQENLREQGQAHVRRRTATGSKQGGLNTHLVCLPTVVAVLWDKAATLLVRHVILESGVAKQSGLNVIARVSHALSAPLSKARIGMACSL